MPDLAVICPVTHQPCVMGCFSNECVEHEVQRIMKLSDDQIMAEHLARFNGDQRLADKAVDLITADIEKALSRGRVH